MPVQLGAALGQAAIEMGMGIALGAINDRRQIKQQKKLQRIQMEGSKEMTDYNYSKQLQMWKDTNYSAQKEELKKAGLNPGLLYGMGGAGGATVGSGGASTTGATATQGGGGEFQTAMGLMLQRAQVQLMEAQAKNLDADTTKKLGVDTTLAETQAKDLTQGIENKKLQAELTKAQTTFQNLRNNITAATTDAEIETIQQQAREAYGNASIALTQANLDTNVRKAREETVRAKLAQIYVETELKKTQTKLTSQQIQESVATVVSLMTKLSQTDRQLDQKDTELEIDKRRNELLDKGIEWGAASNILNGIKDLILKKR